MKKGLDGAPGEPFAKNHKLDSRDTKRAGESTRLLPKHELDDEVSLVKKPVMLLLYSLIVYLLVGELGLGFVVAKKAMLSSFSNVGWWIVFTPFWLGTFASLALMSLSVNAVWKLAANARSIGEYTPLPLLVARFVLVAELVLIPVELMLLWSTILFYKALENPGEHVAGGGLFPIFIVFVCGFLVFILIRGSGGIVTGAFWLCSLVFVALLDLKMGSFSFHPSRPPDVGLYISWWVVFAPLLVLIAALLFRVGYLFLGHHRERYILSSVQRCVLGLYAFAVILFAAGGFLLCVRTCTSPTGPPGGGGHSGTSSSTCCCCCCCGSVGTAAAAVCWVGGVRGGSGVGGTGGGW